MLRFLIFLFRLPMRILRLLQLMVLGAIVLGALLLSGKLESSAVIDFLGNLLH